MVLLASTPVSPAPTWSRLRVYRRRIRVYQQDQPSLSTPDPSPSASDPSLSAQDHPSLSAPARSDCRRLGNTLCLYSPVRPEQAVQESSPPASRAWPLILPSKESKLSITFWNSVRRDCQMTGRDSNLGPNLSSAA